MHRIIVVGGGISGLAAAHRDSGAAATMVEDEPSVAL